MLESFKRPSGEAVRLAAFYAVYFSISGLYAPFWPVFLEARGVRPEDIGLIFGLAMILRPLTVPVYGYVADRYLGLRRALILLAAATALGFGGFAPASGFAPLLASTLFLMLFWPSVAPMADAMTLRAAMAGRLTFGPVRLWGSVGFILMNLAGGVILARFGPNGIYAAIGGMALLTLLMAMLQKAPAEIAGSERAQASLKDLLQFLRRPLILAAILSAALIDATHVLYYAYATLHWRAAGISDPMIGLLWSTGVVAEVALMGFLGRMIASRPGTLFIALGGFGAALRWGLMSLDPALPFLFAIQLLHALTYGATLLGIMSFMKAHVPPHFAGSLQGFLNAVAAGVFSSVLMMSSGLLYSEWQARAFLVMAALGAIGAAVAVAALLLEGTEAESREPAPIGGSS